MRGSPAQILRRLEALRFRFGDGAAEEKLAALTALERTSLRTASEVVRLHDAACFHQAYPEDGMVMIAADHVLGSFSKRSDLRRHRKRLVNSGIAGTEIRFRFFHPMAAWLVRYWPDQLEIDWPALDDEALLEHLLPLLAPFAATPAIDEYAMTVREWIDRLRGRHQTDAAFLVRAFGRMRMEPLAREILHDEVDVPMVLHPGKGTPTRTVQRFPSGKTVYRTQPFPSERPDLRVWLRKPAPKIEPVDEVEGDHLIDLARMAMVTRERDLDAFSHADASDVRLVHSGDGLLLALMGVVPERRLLLESVYAALMLQNVVPIGYVLISSLYGSAEVAFNVFSEFRGAQAAVIYAKVLAATRAIFGADTFMVPPYQLGEGNDEALDSGAWWFYRKLGFFPRDRAVSALARTEEAKVRDRPTHRSSRATLAKLASASLYFGERATSSDILGVLPLPEIGLRVADFVAEEYRGDRDAATSACVAEAQGLLGLSRHRLSDGERLALERWAPLVALLPGIEHWSAEDRDALGAVVLAKGGRRESDFVLAFDRHAKLRAAVRALAERPGRAKQARD